MKRPEHPTPRVREVLEFIQPRSDGVYVDGTLGLGGHAEAILRAVSPPPTVIGIDCDHEMLALAAERLREFSDHVKIVWGRHSQLDTIVRSLGFSHVDGVVLDIGPSLPFLTDPARGISQTSDQPLDARYDRTQQLTAYTVVNEYPEERLAEVLALTGNRRLARKIAATVVRRRKERPIRTPREFAEIVHEVVGRKRKGQIDAAAPWLMAIRAWVNNELGELEAGIEAAAQVLKPGGRLVVLTWDSTQHRTARQTLQRLARGCICPPHLPCTCGRKPVFRLLTPRGLPTPESELATGPATLRTCRLFAAEKLADEETA